MTSMASTSKVFQTLSSCCHFHVNMCADWILLNVCSSVPLPLEYKIAQSFGLLYVYGDHKKYSKQNHVYGSTNCMCTELSKWHTSPISENRRYPAEASTSRYLCSVIMILMVVDYQSFLYHLLDLSYHLSFCVTVCRHSSLLLAVCKNKLYSHPIRSA